MHALILAAVLSQSAPPLVPIEEAQEAVEAPAQLDAPEVEAEVAVATAEELEGDSEFNRSAWRLHFSAGGGIVGLASLGPGLDGGAFVTIGKPLYMFRRKPRHQWVTDSLVFFAYAPASKTGQLVITPTFGSNFYFGPWIGLEWRAGLGFGATPGIRTDVGLGFSLSGAFVVRPFKDDRKRIKLEAREAATYGFLGGGLSTLTTAAIGLSFELPL